MPATCSDACQQNPYQNAYYEAVYTLGRAISITRENYTEDSVFVSEKLLEAFT